MLGNLSTKIFPTPWYGLRADTSVAGQPVPMSSAPVTLVSAYFDVDSKFVDSQYQSWMRGALLVNAPLVFFGSPVVNALVREIRGQLPTETINLELDEMPLWASRDRFATHAIHCPSAELAVIWHSKLHLVEKAVESNYFNSDFYCWYDAGYSGYRDKLPPTEPWPHPENVERLSRTKVSVTSSNRFLDVLAVRQGRYSHYISGGTCLIYRALVRQFVSEYYAAVDECLSRFPNALFCSSDQCVHSWLYLKNPTRYEVIDDGYGSLVPALAEVWRPRSQAGISVHTIKSVAKVLRGR